MRPKKHKTTGSNDLSRARLDQIINLKHELVLLAGKIDWDWIDSEIAPLYSENGRPGIPARALRPEPLAQTARRQAGVAAGRDPAGSVRGRWVTQPGPQAGYGRYHGAAEGHHLSTEFQVYLPLRTDNETYRYSRIPKQPHCTTAWRVRIGNYLSLPQTCWSGPSLHGACCDNQRNSAFSKLSKAVFQPSFC